MEGKKDFARKLSTQVRAMHDSTPAKIKACGLALIVTVCSDLAINLDCIGRLMSVDTAALDGIIRCGAIALALTCLILVLGIVCGDRAKRLFFQVKLGGKWDKSHLAIAIICGLLNILLIAGITYVRYKVGSTETSGMELANQASQALQANMSTGISKHGAEVLLLALMLSSAAVFSTVYGFTITNPHDLSIASSIKRADAEIRAKLAENAFGRSEDFMRDSLAIVDHIADATRHQAKDHIIASLLSMATDPAIATRVYEAAANYKPTVTTDPSPIPNKTTTS